MLLYYIQLTDNLNQHALPGQGAVNVSADWKDLGLMSHSLGADILIQMLQQNNSLARVRVTKSNPLFCACSIVCIAAIIIAQSLNIVPCIPWDLLMHCKRS